MKPKVYLIPNLLGSEGSVSRSIPDYNLEVISQLKHFAVEHLKDSRRFLVRCGLKDKIDQSEFYEWNNKSEAEDFLAITQTIKAGNSIGIISDAGCPGIADPGSKIVSWAHANKIQVEPLVGPSSILMALMGSGMNGQSFAFHGYLARDNHKRKQQIQNFEIEGRKQSQIFMETPYRNQALFDELLQSLKPHTQLCIAVDISLPTETIRRMAISDWKKQQINLHKRPAIFIIGS